MPEKDIFQLEIDLLYDTRLLLKRLVLLLGGASALSGLDLRIDE